MKPIWPNTAASAGYIQHRSQRGGQRVNRRMTGTAPARRVSARRRRMRRSGSRIWSGSWPASTAHRLKPKRFWFSEKRRQRSGGGRRGRMISPSHRQTAVALINEAVTAGARSAKACAALEISDRTLRRWTKDSQIHAGQRLLVARPEPANKLSAAERTAVLDVCNSTEFASLPKPDRAETRAC